MLPFGQIQIRSFRFKAGSVLRIGMTPHIGFAIQRREQMTGSNATEIQSTPSPRKIAASKDGSPASQRVPPEELIAAYRRWSNTVAEMQSLLQSLAARFAGDRDVRFLLAEVLRAAGQDDGALAEYQRLALDSPGNELPRIEQGIEQCRMDRQYFPESYAKHLTTGVYADGENAQVWREYANRDIQRGRAILRLLRQRMPLRGKRILDLGAGYGGMLICMAEQGADAVGIEIDPERARLGRQRLAELGMQAEYIEADVCAPGVIRELGLFDLITCQDVLEHVGNPGEMIRSLCRLVRPGGIIFFQVPNKYGVEQLLADHHFALPGLTALSRKQSIEYWHLASGREARFYDVGYLKTQRYYENLFQRYGVTLETVDRYPSPACLHSFAPLFSQLCDRARQEIHPLLRPEIQHRVRRRIFKVVQLYAHALKQISEGRINPMEVPKACDLVVQRLCVSLWRFIGTRTV
jgi:SAM-dependent methyltransferase